MQSLINWTYGYQPYSDGQYLVLIKTPSGGTRISTDCYNNMYRPGDGWEKYTNDVIEAYCSFDDIISVRDVYLFDENVHYLNNKTLRDLHCDVVNRFCNDIRDGDKEIYKNKHFTFVKILEDYLREVYNVKFEPNKLQFVDKDEL
jgi:hypothetical protein